LFEAWLDRHFPDRKNKILHRVRELRGGTLNDSRFGVRMRGEGVFSDQMNALYTSACKKMGILGKGPELSTEHFRNPGNPQLPLFEG
jgi:DNA repair photolyase